MSEPVKPVFTDEDVNLLRFVVDASRFGVKLSEEALAKIDTIADRIQVLLPPEKK